MARLAEYFVIFVAMIFTYQEHKVNASPAPDPCLFKRVRRPPTAEAIRDVEETTTDESKAKMMQIETLLKELWYLDSTNKESSEPEVLNNIKPSTIPANDIVKKYIEFLGMLMNSF